MRKIAVLLVVVTVVVVLVLTPRLLSRARTQRIANFLSSPDRVDLYFVGQKEPVRKDPPSVTLTGEEDIQAFIGGLKLKRKRHCACAHQKMIRFWNTTQWIDVSVCDHCFTVIDDRALLSRARVSSFAMPDALWRRFCEIEKRTQKSKRRNGEPAAQPDGEDAAG
ncbi:MAG: hypothetical protein ACYSYM_10985 [Planctomycetota bacterium]